MQVLLSFVYGEMVDGEALAPPGTSSDDGELAQRDSSTDCDRAAHLRSKRAFVEGEISSTSTCHEGAAAGTRGWNSGAS